MQEFRRRLLDHLLARIRGQPYTGDEHDFTDSDRDQIIFDHNQIYEHKIIQFMLLHHGRDVHLTWVMLTSV
jgi:hypothetical protein